MSIGFTETHTFGGCTHAPHTRNDCRWDDVIAWLVGPGRSASRQESHCLFQRLRLLDQVAALRGNGGGPGPLGLLQDRHSARAGSLLLVSVRDPGAVGRRLRAGTRDPGRLPGNRGGLRLDDVLPEHGYLDSNPRWAGEPIRIERGSVGDHEAVDAGSLSIRFFLLGSYSGLALPGPAHLPLWQSRGAWPSDGELGGGSRVPLLRAYRSPRGRPLHRHLSGHLLHDAAAPLRDLLRAPRRVGCG